MNEATCLVIDRYGGELGDDWVMMMEECGMNVEERV